MDETQIKEPVGSLDVEKTVKRMNYWLGGRTSDIVMEMWNDIPTEGEAQEILECLKTNNFEFNLYEAWKEYLEGWDEDDEEAA